MLNAEKTVEPLLLCCLGEDIEEERLKDNHMCNGSDFEERFLDMLGGFGSY